jgi:hypothetical protein
MPAKATCPSCQKEITGEDAVVRGRAIIGVGYKPPHRDAARKAGPGDPSYFHPGCFPAAGWKREGEGPLKSFPEDGS